MSGKTRTAAAPTTTADVPAAGIAGASPETEFACERHPEPSAIAEQVGPVTHALFRITRMNKSMIGTELRSLGLVNGQELLLLQLWERDGCSQADLGARLGVDPSTVTKMLQRLERDGWVTRAQSALDGRAVVVNLTPKGTRMKRRVVDLWAALERETVAALSHDERERLLALLRKVDAGIRERF
jgi:MarR family transcriptional regulator, organic hydroperoxide resistance regulator